MRILSVQCAGLGWNCLADGDSPVREATGLRFSPLATVFPAVTCTAQATFRTAAPPSVHGVVCNGRYDRRSFRTEFWGQSCRLVEGPRIWDGLRRRGGRCGILFNQQSLGESADLVVNPAPIHRHHGGMLQGCHCKPPALEQEILAASPRKFSLADYWGPLANHRSSEWITDATCRILELERPDFLMTYLPHLDYGLQKHGPQDARRLRPELAVLGGLLRRLLAAADRLGYEVLVWGDYGISRADSVCCPNRFLRQAGLFSVRAFPCGRTYPNLYDSRAFALADHQVAHVYVRDPGDLPEVLEVCRRMPGVGSARPPAEIPGLCHPNCGELVLEAAPGAWFAYPWWEDRREEPDYAAHVDIHSKIGFDPCELFWGIPWISIDRDLRRPQGTHGRQDCPAAAACTDGLAGRLDLSGQLALSRSLRETLDRR